ncbi:MAG TPA: PAS domain S-box protein [Rhizomicrobium sp.]|nr:PAS domain S-box protein [Rhizomicrobium sp.]
MNHERTSQPGEWSLPLDSDVLFGALLATAVDGIMVIDASGRLLVYSDACVRMFGYERAEVLGRNVKMLMPPPYYADHDSYLARYRDTGERRIIGVGREVVGRRKNGTTFPMYLSVGEGVVEGRRIFIGIVHDVSERKRSAEIAQRLASIVEFSDDAIISMDLSGVITSWNAGAERLYGYAAQEIVGLPIATIVPANRQDEEPGILNQIERGERIAHFETQRLHKDGSLVDVSLTVSPMRDANGAITGLSKIARNIGQRRAQERRIGELQGELLHATRLVSTGQLGAALAHELNQPLTAILNYAGVLQEVGGGLPGSEGEVLREVVGRILEQTQRAGEIIRRLRGFVAKREPDRQIHDLNETVEESLALGLVGSAYANIRLRTNFAAELPPVFIDRVQIQQVMINLLRNAVEAMQSVTRRELNISTSPDDDEHVRVSVADTGPGLPLEIAATLFQPFMTTKDQGLGIGLSICRSIVELHGGRLWTEPNEGGGAIFHFRLPVAAEEPDAI